jgi:hypothetical protein
LVNKTCGGRSVALSNQPHFFLIPEKTKSRLYRRLFVAASSLFLSNARFDGRRLFLLKPLKSEIKIFTRSKGFFVFPQLTKSAKKRIISMEKYSLIHVRGAVRQGKRARV